MFAATIVIATFLCCLVAGFLFAFAVVVMPGLGDLDDGEFIRAFQVMDRVIQDNQPLFVIVWAGSVVTLLLALLLGLGQLSGVDRTLLSLATTLYILGVQVPTLIVNVPLNNRLQRVDVASLSAAERGAARADFEPRWNRWNGIRTVLSSLVAVALVALLFRL